MHRTTARHADRDLPTVVRNGEPFRSSGSFYGTPGTIGTGYLPVRFAEEYRARLAHITYTIVSYATPIAWLDDEYGWIVPDVVYSVTTSRHQSGARFAIGPRGSYDTAPRLGDPIAA